MEALRCPAACASAVEVAVELGVGASLFKRKIAAAIKAALVEHLKA